MIIILLLDMDFYKFMMMQVVLYYFFVVNVEYCFWCCMFGVDFVLYIDEICDEVCGLCLLCFFDVEFDYLWWMCFIKSDFVDFFVLFYLNEKYILVMLLLKGNGEIDIVIEGLWLYMILFEILVFVIVNEVYFCNMQCEFDYCEGCEWLCEKIKLFGVKFEFVDCKIVDYGMCWCFLKVWYEEVVFMLCDGFGLQFVGMSNVLYVMKYDIMLFGMMVYEYLQVCQVFGLWLCDLQIYGFEMWVKEYCGDFGIVLLDVYGMDVFLNDFDMYFCKLFDGVCYDLGDLFEWGEWMLCYYEVNWCDLCIKVLVFLDVFDILKVMQLYEWFCGCCKFVFGVGINFINDFGYVLLQIVIKMVCCNGQLVVKLFDLLGKSMCDDKVYFVYLWQVFGIVQLVEEDVLKQVLVVWLKVCCGRGGWYNLMYCLLLL